MKRAAEYLDGLAKESAGNVPLQRELATANQRLGDILGGGGVSNLGDIPGAEVRYNAALAMWEELAARRDAEPTDLENLARLRVEHSRFLLVRGALDRSEQSAADAVALLRTPRGERAGGERHAGMLATSLHQLGYIQSRRGKNTAALASFGEAVHYASNQLKTLPEDPRELQRSARIEADYASQLQRAGRAAEAVDAARAARRKLEGLLATDPHNVRTQQTLALALQNEATALAATGDRKGSVTVFGEAVKVSEALRAASPTDQSAQIGAMLAHYALGVALLQFGDTTEGIATLRNAVVEAEAVRKISSGNDYIINQLASIKLELGEALLTSHPQSAEGCRHLDEGLGLWDGLAKRSAVPEESGRHRKRFEVLRAQCHVPRIATQIRATLVEKLLRQRRAGLWPANR